VVKFDLYFDAEGIDSLNSSATGIFGAEFKLDFDASQLDSVSAFASEENSDWLMDVVFESNVFAASTSNNVTGIVALGSPTAIVDIDPGNDTGRNTVLLEQKIGTIYLNPKEDLDSIELMITDMDIATDIGSVQPLDYGVSLDATMIDALIKVDETHYLNNTTINYFKEGVDTAISTLVEDGGIKIEESIDFDAVLRSEMLLIFCGTLLISHLWIRRVVNFMRRMSITMVKLRLVMRLMYCVTLLILKRLIPLT